MKTLIVPCAGKSSRFPNVRPKWMLYYPDGRLMVEKAIEGLELDTFDQIIITITQQQCDDYNADKILNDAFGFTTSSKYKLCILDNYTSSQSETVYLTLLDKAVKDEFVVKDSDNYIEADIPPISNFVVGLNVSTCKNDVSRLNAKSFLKLNEQHNIIDIIEKKIVSDEICVGMYGFESAEVFIDAYKRLSNINLSRYEIYISHIISYLLGTKKAVYKCIEAKKYEDWGTLSDWRKILQCKKTYIVNIDGVLYEHRERYGAEEAGKCIDGNFKTLKRLYDNGAQIILISSMPESRENEILKDTNRYGIEIHGLIMNCYQSHETLIQGYSNEISFPACTSINIKNEGQLEDLLNEE